MRFATVEDLMGDRSIEELRYARLVAAELTQDSRMGLQVYAEMVDDPRGFLAALQVLLVEVISDVTLNLTANSNPDLVLEAVRARIAKLEGSRHG